MLHLRSFLIIMSLPTDTSYNINPLSQDPWGGQGGGGRGPNKAYLMKYSPLPRCPLPPQGPSDLMKPSPAVC